MSLRIFLCDAEFWGVHHSYIYVLHLTQNIVFAGSHPILQFDICVCAEVEQRIAELPPENTNIVYFNVSEINYTQIHKTHFKSMKL